MIEEALQQAIDENLSAEVAKRLQVRLARLDDLEKEVESLRESCASKDRTISRLNNQILDHEYIRETRDEIDIKKVAIEKQIAIQEIRKEMTEKMLEQNFDLVKSVFQNRQITRVTHWDGSIPVADNHGYVNSHFANGTTQTTEDEK